MTVEEMQARIAELEQENEKLRKNQKKNDFPIIPKEIDSHFPWLKTDIEQDGIDTPIGRLIRSVCFPKVKVQKHIYDYQTGTRKLEEKDTAILVSKMTEEQYKHYSGVMYELLNVLSNYQKYD